MKFYDDMPDIEANDDLILMVGNPLDSNAPRKTTLAKIKAFIRTNWSIAFGDLGDKPKINGVELKGGNNTLSELKIASSDEVKSRVAIDTKKVKSLLLNEDDIIGVYFRLHQEEREGVEAGDLKLSVEDLFKPLATFDVVGVTFKEIVHNMGEDFYPSVKFLDTEGNLVACSVKYSSGGIILVSWNDEKSGKIILTR